MQRVFHFSGGPSSGLLVLNFYRVGDIVIFCDTGREDKDTYRFVRDFERENNIPVVWIHGNWQKDVIQKEKMIPNYFKRKCTINLKIKAARRYLFQLGIKQYVQFIGFRYDERERVNGYKSRWKKVQTRFPLYECKLTGIDVDVFWSSIPYRLTIPPILKNCDLCFMKGEDAVMAIIQNDPSKADKWIDDEENEELNPKKYTYFKGKTIRQLRDAALSLNKVYKLEDFQPKYKCACSA